MKITRLFLALAVISGATLSLSWAYHIHDTRAVDRMICRKTENTNTALRSALNIRIHDPSTSADVKERFRLLIRRYLQPVDC